MLHYTSYGPLDAPVIWVCHALTASSEVDAWWPGLFGPGRLLDPTLFRIICPNNLGSCYGSPGPDNWAGQPDDYPLITVKEMAQAQLALADELGIEQVHRLIGGSLGGMQAMEMAILNPHFAQRLTLLACPARQPAWAQAWNHAQRMALDAATTPEGGLAAARAIAMLSYRTYEQFEATQSEPDEDRLEHYAAARYLEYQGRKLVERFSAASYRTLTLAMDTHHVGRDRGGLISALGQIKADTQVIAISSDGLFPPAEQRLLAHLIPQARLAVIDSPYGHDGFLVEAAKIEEAILAMEASLGTPYLDPSPALSTTH